MNALLLQKARSLTMPALIMTLIGCAAAVPHTIKVTEAELQSKIAQTLAVPITVLKIFDISLSNPVIRLDAGTERLNAQLDTDIRNPFSSEPLSGKLNISGKLRFDAASNSVMLANARIDNLNLNGLGGKYSAVLSLLASKLGEEILNNIPLYTLTAEDLKVGSTEFVPKDFKVVGNELQVTLVPK
jgi:hypothetical protein